VDERNFWNNRRISRRAALRGAGLGIAGLAGAALIGCGDDDEDSTASSTAAPATTSAAAAATTTAQPQAAIKTGGFFRTADDAVAPHFSPYHPGVDPSWPNTWRRNTAYYDKLWHLRDVPDASRQLYMRLAESLEQVDETTFVVKLNRANFQNNPKSSKFNSIVNGRQLTAEDIVARYNFVKEAPASSNTLLKSAWTVTAVDDLTIEYKTDGPFAFFLEDNEGAMNRGYEVPQEMLDETVLKEEAPIGTGPYMFDSYQVGSREVAVRNPGYFIKDRPYMDKIQYTVLQDNAAQEAAFRAGVIDAHTSPDIKEAEGITRDLGDKVTEYAYSSGTGMVIMLNIRRAPFTDIRMREAITRAIDRDRVGNVVYFGDFTQESYFPASRTTRFPVGWDAVEPQLGYDPTKAKQLVDAMKADGSYDGRELHFMLPVEAQTWVDGGRLIAEDLEAVGIKVRTEPIVRNIYLGRAGPRPADGSPSDFDITMTVYLNYTHFHSKTGSFWANAGLEDPEIDAMLDKITSTVDSEERQELSKAWELEQAKRYGNFIPVLGLNEHRLYYSHVKGVDFEKGRNGYDGWQIDQWLGDGREEA
jgi:peptide/nickel transport system substrate-binding protein